MTDLTLYDPIGQMQFAGNYCFLCGQPVGTTHTVPVFPDWLTSTYTFADQEILLLDKQIVTYKELTLPCCQNCKEQNLEPLEEQVHTAAARGLIGWQALSTHTIFKWAGKIFYGMLVRELVAEQNPLIKPQYLLTDDIHMLDKLRSLTKILQSIRVPMVFSDFVPCSVFVLPVKATPDDLPFEFRDDLHSMTISFKMGETLLICCLLDNGIIKEAMDRLWQQVEGKALHPKQAAEFSAQVYYAAYLLNVIPEYFVRPVKPGDQYLVLDTLIDDITASVFNPYQVTGYAQMLEEMLKRWSITMADILKQPNQPLSYLFDAEGTFRDDIH